MTSAKVALKKTGPETLLEDLRTVLDLSGCTDRIQATRQVLLKPNLVTDKPDYIRLGANTSIEVLEALLIILSDFGCQTGIGESETGTEVKGRRLEPTWKLMGLDQLAHRYGAKLLNFSRLPTVWTDFQGRGLPGLPLPQALLECDLLIDLPKIKTHKYAVLTCAMKNLYGLIPEPRRVIYHRWLNETIADLAVLLDPKMITVVDGLVGMEGNGPLYGKAVHLDLLLASQSCCAIDRTVCDLIGCNPKDVRYIRLAEEQGLSRGPVEVVGDAMEDRRRRFEPVAFNAYRWFEKKLMESPLVHMVTSAWFQRHVSSRIAGLTQRLRGGGYSWYLDK
jgi:uncharacterized protein (DUF362 family)